MVYVLILLLVVNVIGGVAGLCIAYDVLSGYTTPADRAECYTIIAMSLFLMLAGGYFLIVEVATLFNWPLT